MRKTNSLKKKKQTKKNKKNKKKQKKRGQEYLDDDNYRYVYFDIYVLI